MNEFISSFFPPIESMHPVVVHFPLALLPVAFLFIVATLIWEQHRQLIAVVAFVLIVMGSVGCYVAVITGLDAKTHAVVTTQNSDTLERHEDKADTVWLLFSVLMVGYGAIVLGSHKYPLYAQKYFTVVTVIYLIGYCFALVQLVMLGHLGGTLVHLYGVHAIMK